MGPFTSSRGHKYILVAVDYVSKSVKAIASPTNDARMVFRFFKRVIFPGFGMLRVLISDGGSHFIQRKFKAMHTKYRVHHKKELGYRPQISGQGEVSN